MEQYIRAFTNYQQNDWLELLSTAEFAYNNSRHSTTGVSPFYANYGYNPRWTAKFVTPKGSTIPAAEDFVQKIQHLHEQLAERVTEAQNTQAKYYDAKHKPVEFQPGDLVWLLPKNLKTRRPSKKLDHKRLGPFTVLEKRGLQSYRLDLPKTLNIHPVFHISLLEKHVPDAIPGRTQVPPPPIELDQDDEEGPWYIVDQILDCRCRGRGIQYLIRWEGWTPEHDSWEPPKNLKNIPDLVAEYHEANPSKPRPAALTGARAQRRG